MDIGCYQGYFQKKLPLLFYRGISSSMWCSSGKNTFLGAGSLQMITNKVWCENTCVLFLVPVLCIFLFLKKLKDILGADYIKKNVNWAGLCKTTNCSLILHKTTLLRLWEGDELFEIKSFTWNISESNQPLKCFLKLFFFKNLLTKSCKSNFYVSVVNYSCTYIFKGSNYRFAGLLFKTYFKNSCRPGLVFYGSGPDECRLAQFHAIRNLSFSKAFPPNRLPFHLGSRLHIISSFFSQFCLF